MRLRLLDVADDLKDIELLLSADHLASVGQCDVAITVRHAVSVHIALHVILYFT